MCYLDIIVYYLLSSSYKPDVGLKKTFVLFPYLPRIYKLVKTIGNHFRSSSPSPPALFFEDAVPEDTTTALGLTTTLSTVPTMAEEKEKPASPTGAAADKAPPLAKLTYAEALRARVAAAVNGRLDAAHRQLRGQELLLLTLLCLCCTLLCVFVTHRQGCS
jgi:hypothetical protein